MSKEIQASIKSGTVNYIQIIDKNGRYWNTSSLSFENYQTANIGNYYINLTEQGVASGIGMADFPSQIPAGVYSVIGRQRSGGSPAESDTFVAGPDAIHWNGSDVVWLGNVKLSSDGLDSISTTHSTGVPTNFRQIILWLYRRFAMKFVYNKTNSTGKAYDNDGTTVITTQSITVSNDGKIQTQGPIS